MQMCVVDPSVTKLSFGIMSMSKMFLGGVERVFELLHEQLKTKLDQTIKFVFRPELS